MPKLKDDWYVITSNAQFGEKGNEFVVNGDQTPIKIIIKNGQVDQISVIGSLEGKGGDNVWSQVEKLKTFAEFNIPEFRNQLAEHLKTGGVTTYDAWEKQDIKQWQEEQRKKRGDKAGSIQRQPSASPIVLDSDFQTFSGDLADAKPLPTSGPGGRQKG